MRDIEFAPLRRIIALQKAEIEKIIALQKAEIEKLLATQQRVAGLELEIGALLKAAIGVLTDHHTDERQPCMVALAEAVNNLDKPKGSR